MASIVADPAGTALRAGYEGLVELARAVEYPLEPFQRRVARAIHGRERECLIELARGNAKSSLIALTAVHELLANEEAKIYCVAASVPQARILFEYAADFARRLDHPNVVHRHLELRFCPDPDEPTVFTRHMRVLASEPARLHGLSASLLLLDELQAVTRSGIYEALASSLHKRSDSKLITISTAGSGASSPLGALRQRALALPDVKRSGALIDCRGADLRALMWEVPPEASVDSMREVKKANPASWLTPAVLKEQRARLPDIAYRRYVCDQWVSGSSSWLEPGSWQRAAGEPRFEEGEPIHVAVDLGGGQRSTSALVWVQRHGEEYHVGSAITGSEYPVEFILGELDGLGKRYRIAELTADEWRAPGLLEEARQRGIPVTVFPQSDSRMAPASQRLFELITAGKIVHAGDELLDAHILAAVARQSRRGWRLERPDRNTPVDGAIALCMAIDAASKPQPEVRFLGWL
jgi:phage terminase large subunit-like protein